jgi:hypothetical protein
MYIEARNAVSLCRLDMHGAEFLDGDTASVCDSAECSTLASGVMSETSPAAGQGWNVV